MKTIILEILTFIIRACNYLKSKIEISHSKLLIRKPDRSLYRTPDGDLFWLNVTGYVDRCIINEGIFEKKSVQWLPYLLKEGDIVLDIGANIGYYSVLISKIIGKTGFIYAFEPTKHFCTILKNNLDENKINNVEIFEYGLSNKNQELEIFIGPSSATLHEPEGYEVIEGKEKIKLTTLDEFVKDKNLNRIDFIKIDVDGHEPLFFEGAWSSLDKFSPIILCEISHLHYFTAGFTAWDFYREVRKHNYHIYHEDKLEIMDTENMFLRKCANFDRSTNIILSKKHLDVKNIK